MRNQTCIEKKGAQKYEGRHAHKTEKRHKRKSLVKKDDTEKKLVRIITGLVGGGVGLLAEIEVNKFPREAGMEMG